jgi:hypothetical protein
MVPTVGAAAALKIKLKQMISANDLMIADEIIFMERVLNGLSC